MTEKYQSPAATRAAALFDDGFYCAESVLMALAESMEIHSDLIPRIATGFCSGVSRLSNTCGAVSGVIMAYGLAYGRNTTKKDEEYVCAMVQEFIQRFETAYGSSNCKALIDCDLNTEEGQRKYHQEGLVKRCRELTAGAVEIAIPFMDEGV